MKTDFLIIGGGVAGLSAANHLADNGADVTLLEGGSYPAHKICGEFLSPEAIPLLEKWDIPINASIQNLTLMLPQKMWSMKLPSKAATCTRYSLDEALANRAKQKGANIQTSAQVKNIEVTESFIVTLESGEQWQAPTLLVSTGRCTDMNTPKFCYVGAKAHFEGIHIPNELVMHLMPGAYFGIAPIGLNKVNVAGLIACTPEQAKNPKATLESFFKCKETRILKDQLEKCTLLYEDWLTGPVPEFGIRHHPQWPNALFIGDAAGVIPPATGNGLAMGLSSGILAAEYALKGQSETYQKQWNKVYRGRISKGMLLHRLFLSPTFSRAIPLVSSLIPALPYYLFKTTRE